jgi:hypothetical protein
MKTLAALIERELQSGKWSADGSGVLAVSILKRKVNVTVCFHFCINDAPRKRIPFFLGLAASICTRRSHSSPQWGGRNW